jgi:hypothetical protein
MADVQVVVHEEILLRILCCNVCFRMKFAPMFFWLRLIVPLILRVHSFLVQFVFVDSLVSCANGIEISTPGKANAKSSEIR